MNRFEKRQLEDIMDRTGHGFAILDENLVVSFANTLACRHTSYTVDNIVGLRVDEALPLGSEVLKMIHQVHQTGEPITRDFYTRRIQNAWLHLEIFRANERICVMFRDITEQRRQQDELRESEQQALLFANSIPQLAWMADADGNTIWFNKRWYDYTGTHKRSMAGWGWRRVVHPDHIDDVLAQIREAYVAAKPWEATFPILSKEGEYRWFLCKAVPQLNRDGKVIKWFGTNTDITEQREGEMRQQIMMDELDHRVKNIMTTIQSVARSTLRHSKTLAEFDSVFSDRLQSLNKTNDLLTQHRWKGATLQEILELEAAPFNSDAVKRFTIQGPEVRYGPKTVISVSMAFHELVTNAVKYGALSNDRGHVSVTWALKPSDKGDRLSLIWLERDGPPVAVPDRRGFGTVLVQKILAPELNGTVDIHFRPSGLVCEMDLSSVGTRD